MCARVYVCMRVCVCVCVRARARIRACVSRSVCIFVRITRTNSQRDGRVAMFGGARGMGVGGGGAAGVVGIDEMILQGLEP